MSSPEEQPELKAGHPPAVKAGGMRITQHKPVHPEKTPVVDNKKEENKEDEEEVEGEAVEPSTTPKQHLVISGAPARGDEDFPSAAIKAFHEKPMPTNDFRAASSKPSVIHQPRK